MPFNFTGKKVLVTGAGKGIGRAVAIELSKNGCKVYALSRTRSTLDTLVEENQNIVPLAVDLEDWEATKQALEKLEVLDGLVNNAGIGGHDFFAVDTPKEYMNKVLDNNLLSAINCTQVVAKKMIEEKVKGSIINVSSAASIMAFKKGLAYNVSKAAMDMVSKQFALELGPHGIRVNSINSAGVRTPMLEGLINSGVIPENRLGSRSAMGRILELHEIVEPILYLLSDYSTMVTGTLHVVDGGLVSNIKMEG